MLFGNTFQSLLDIAFTLYGALLLLRLWLQFARIPPYNPISRAVFRASDWIVPPLRRVLGGRGGIDWACLVAAWLTALVFLMAALATLGFDPLILFPSALWIALIITLKWAINLVVWVTLLMAILSWVNPAAPVMPVLMGLTAPLLNPIRRLMPNTGGFDFSPLVLFVLGQVVLTALTRLLAMNNPLLFLF